MLLTDHLPLEQVKVPIEARTRREVIRELCALLVSRVGGDVDGAVRAIEEREDVLGTGIGYGVAMPHARTRAVPELGVVCGLAPHPLPFTSLDGEPVRLVFLVAGPDAVAGQHVRLLSRIARLVRQRQVRDRLLMAPSSADLHRVLLEAEER